MEAVKADKYNADRCTDWYNENKDQDNKKRWKTRRKVKGQMKATLYLSRQNENTPSKKKKGRGSDAGGDNAGWVTSEYEQWVISSSTHAKGTDRTPARCKAQTVLKSMALKCQDS